MTILRIGNVLGADALIGGAGGRGITTLDPVPGCEGGPLRSYIGPRSLAFVLAGLFQQAALGQRIDPVLNIAVSPAVAMADLLDAAGLDWRFGPINPNVVPRVVLDTSRLQALVPLSSDAALPNRMIAEWQELKGKAK